MGAAVALPFLDAMTPAFAASSSPPNRRSAWPSSMCRMASTCGTGPRITRASSSELPRILKPLEPFKNDITVLGNLTHNNGRALLDGAGDHGRCCGAYLTGVQPRKSAVDIKCGHLRGPDCREQDRQRDALPIARSRSGRRAPGRRLRFRLLLRVHEQPRVAQ